MIVRQCALTIPGHVDPGNYGEDYASTRNVGK